jgi:hypothetical protein
MNIDLDELYAKLQFKNNPNLRPCNVSIPYSLDQAEEIQKCIDDPVYFICNYVKVVHPDRGVVLMELYDYQKEMINNYHLNRYNIVKTSRQMGKCLGKNTNIRVRKKSTGETMNMTIGEFYDRNK